MQFQWERYENEVEELSSMSREEVVTMLKRQSTGFSRCQRLLCPAVTANCNSHKMLYFAACLLTTCLSYSC
jgi:hypothetical protein